MTLGLASASIPDFVSGVVLQYVIGVRLGWLPAISDVPDDAGAIGQFEYLLLPALAVVAVYFGYIARITRAGTITALDADYTRTAFMKGLPTRAVMSRHVMRNGLQPTVAVTGTQIGYLFGGLVGLELVFNYPGLGRLILRAATTPDFPLLQAGVIMVAIIFMLMHARRRPAHRLDEPPYPSAGGIVSEIDRRSEWCARREPPERPEHHHVGPDDIEARRAGRRRGRTQAGSAPSGVRCC